MSEEEEEVACIIAEMESWASKKKADGAVFYLVSATWFDGLKAATEHGYDVPKEEPSRFSEMVHGKRLLKVSVRDSDIMAIPEDLFQRLNTLCPIAGLAWIPRRVVARGGADGELDLRPILCLVTVPGGGVNVSVLLERGLVFDAAVARMAAENLTWPPHARSALVSPFNGSSSKPFGGTTTLDSLVPPDVRVVNMRPPPPPKRAAAAPSPSPAAAPEVVDVDVDPVVRSSSTHASASRGGGGGAAAAVTAAASQHEPVEVKVGGTYTLRGGMVACRSHAAAARADLVDAMVEGRWQRALVTCVDGVGLQATPLRDLKKGWIRNTPEAVAPLGTRDLYYKAPEPPRLAQGSVGMRNLGNTCFMSSMLQCLGAIEPLVRRLLGPEMVAALSAEDAMEFRIVPREFCALLRSMWLDTWKGSLDYTVLRREFVDHGPGEVFKGSDQHDSQEFYQLFLDEIVRTLKVAPTSPIAGFIEGLFGVGLRDEKRCADCGKRGPHDAPQTLSLCVPFPAVEVVFFPVGAPAQIVQVVVGTHVEEVLRTVASRVGLPINTLACAKCVTADSEGRPGHVELVYGGFTSVDYGEHLVVFPVAPAPEAGRAVPPAKEARLAGSDGDAAAGGGGAGSVASVEEEPSSVPAYPTAHSLWSEKRIVLYILASPDVDAGFSKGEMPQAATCVKVMIVSYTMAGSWPSESEVYAGVMQAVGARLAGAPRVALWSTSIYSGGDKKLSRDGSSIYYGASSVGNLYFVVPQSAAVKAYGQPASWPDLPELSAPSVSVDALGLEGCIKSMLSEEELRADSLWQCPKCDRKVKSYQKVTVTSSPQVLAVHLKRFGFNAATKSRHKIDARVAFPTHGLQFHSKKYDLVGVSCHAGSVDSGHYTARTRNFVDGRWYILDDETTSLSSEGDLSDARVQKEAYMLFYVAHDYKGGGGAPGGTAS